MSFNTLPSTAPKQISTNDDESLQSPNAIAEFALAAAILKRESDARKQALDSCMTGEEIKENHSSASIVNVHGESLNDKPKKKQRILITDDKGAYGTQRQKGKRAIEDNDSVWNFAKMESKTNHSILEKSKWALKKTEQVLNEEMHIVFKIGVNAFHQCDSLERELKYVKDLSNARQLEIKRLQKSDKESRATISKLLRTIEASKSETHDSCRAAQNEMRLRSEISSLRLERDEAKASVLKTNRKSNLMDEELKLLKSKLARITQERIKMERDSRAAISLARSFDNHTHSDIEFYKRKAADLTGRLKSKDSIILEQELEIKELKRQVERSISQNKLVQLRTNSSKQQVKRY